MKLYFKYLSMHLKSILEYKKVFIISGISQIATSFLALIAIFFLFDKFGNIKGYSFKNVLICFSISYLGFSLAEAFFRAFDEFDKMIGNGEFDRILVRPRNLILQVLGTKIMFEKFGRAIVALTICIIVIVKNPMLIRVDKLVVLSLMIVGSVVIYSSLMILKAGITFFTTQSLEIMNIFTDGSRDLSQYPLDIYQKWVRKFFTYILPIALVNYYPLQYLIGNTDNILIGILPIFSLLFIIPCLLVWKIGVRKYKSTGS